MAPKRKKAIERRSSSRRRKRSNFIKNTSSPPCSINSDVTSTSSSSTATSQSLIPAASGCCTPKSDNSRIPEMLTCPPAPKKQKVGENCALRRRQIAFFAPPDVELFFLFGLPPPHINK